MSYRFVKIFLFIIVSSGSYFDSVHSAGSVIWRCDKNEFFPIKTIPAFCTAQQDYLKTSRQLEIEKFQNKTLRVGFVEVKNVIHFTENNTKVSGFFGEMWNTLSEHLNFTLIPVNIFGTPGRLQNSSNDNPRNMLIHDEIHVFVGTGHPNNLGDVIQTIPVLQKRYYLYVKPTVAYAKPQISHMFSPIVLFLIFLLFIFLSVFGYLIQRTSNRVSRSRRGCHHLFDHFFYTFSVLCSQGFLPDSFYRHTKIISFTKAMFVIIILTSAGSRLVSDTSNLQTQPPFEDLSSMFANTNYSIILTKRLFPDYVLKEMFGDFIGDEKYSNRFVDIVLPYDKYNKICFGNEKYALLTSDVTYQTHGKTQCNLIPVGKPKKTVWMGATVSKTFKNLKALNMGILKLMESGLLDRLKKRWLSSTINDEPTMPQPVGLRQVAIPFAVLGIGMIASIIIFIIEHIVYNYNINRR